MKLILIYFAITIAVIAVVQGATTPAITNALKDFYTATGGSSWTPSCSARWNTGDPCEQSWFGITCDSTQTMIQFINLGRCNLAGILHGGLGSITTLKSLQLGNNKLTGPIPSTWSSLTSLSTLDISFNSLTGTLGWVRPLTALKMLKIDNNTFTDSLAFLVQLNQLQVFSANYNFLTGTIPSQISQSTFLQSISLSHNRLSGSLQSLGNLPSLSVLNVAFNSFTGVVPNLPLVTLGSFQNNNFQCPIPSFATGAIITASCNYCLPGYAVTNGQCMPCTPGQYSDGMGSCIDCPFGSYSADAAAPRCETCPPGTFSAGSIGCQSVVQVAATVGAWFAFGVGLIVALMLCCMRRQSGSGYNDEKGLKQTML